MTTNQTKELKKKLGESQIRDFKIAWKHMNWQHKAIYVLGCIALSYLSYKLGQWLVH